MDELKSCPFCGKEAELNTHSEKAYIICKECRGRGPVVLADVSYCAIDKAAELWNRRNENENS